MKRRLLVVGTALLPLLASCASVNTQQTTTINAVVETVDPVAREILLRGDFVRGRRMLAFLCICVAMAISACYELIEWAAAIALGQGADEFLGTQGDVWDTQSDMFMALMGASSALALLTGWHDRQIATRRR